MSFRLLLIVLFLLENIVCGPEVFVGSCNQGETFCILDPDTSQSLVVGDICCGEELGDQSAGNGSFALAFGTKPTTAIYMLFRPKSNRAVLNAAKIDPCSGAVQVDWSFTLNDSFYAMPFTIDPQTGLGYALQTFKKPYAFYELDFEKKTQTLIANLNVSSLVLVRQLAINPLNNSIVYGIQQLSGGGGTRLLALRKNGEVIFADRTVSGIFFSLTFDSSGQAFVVTVSNETTLYRFDIDRLTSSFVRRTPNIADMRSAIAVPRTFARCLASAGLPSDDLILTTTDGSKARYPATPYELGNGNVFYLNDQSIPGRKTTSFNVRVAAPLDTRELEFTNVTLNGKVTGLLHTESYTPWMLFNEDAMSNQLVVGDWFVAFRAKNASGMFGPIQSQRFTITNVMPTTTTTVATTISKTATTTPTTTATDMTVRITLPATDTSTAPQPTSSASTMSSLSDAASNATSAANAPSVSSATAAPNVLMIVLIVVGVIAAILLVVVLVLVFNRRRSSSLSSPPSAPSTQFSSSGGFLSNSSSNHYGVLRTDIPMSGTSLPTVNAQQSTYGHAEWAPPSPTSGANNYGSMLRSTSNRSAEPPTAFMYSNLPANATLQSAASASSDYSALSLK